MPVSLCMSGDAFCCKWNVIHRDPDFPHGFHIFNSLSLCVIWLHYDKIETICAERKGKQKTNNNNLKIESCIPKNKKNKFETFVECASCFSVSKFEFVWYTKKKHLYQMRAKCGRLSTRFFTWLFRVYP